MADERDDKKAAILAVQAGSLELATEEDRNGDG